MTDTRTWPTHHRACVSRKSPLGEALTYMANTGTVSRLPD